MKMLYALVAAAAAALALAATPVSAAPVQFSAHLDGASEAPPNGSTAFGDARVTLDNTTFTVAVHVDFSGLTQPATAAHIHCCTAIPFTGVVGVFQGFPGFPSATAGTYDNVFTLTSARFATLFNGIEGGSAYVNIHNATFPGGEIRGFLIQEQPTLIPEPGTLVLVLAGFGLAGATIRRRRGAA